ncbi:MAG: insulinase family protein [Deltaproteobacteria bacterium]|nr:insulinase family protein [Deltaproteobacteria bacterium]
MARRLVLIAALAPALLLACATARPKPEPPASQPAAPATPLIRTVALPSPGNPLVSIRLVFRTGSIDDPTGRAGLAALTAHMMAAGGAGEHTYSELLDALYPMAASIGVSVTRETTTISGTVHRDNLAAFTDLLATQVVSPTVATEDFERLRREASDHITQRLRSQDDEALGKEALEATLYAGHPYGHPPTGTVSGLATITPYDVKAFHHTFFTQDALTLGVAGGYPEGYVEDLRGRLEKLQPHRPAREALPEVPAHEGLDVVIVAKETDATAISIGRPLPLTRADDDFYPLLVAASYLGEHRTFNGVLMQNMRGKRGLNYGDYAYIEKFIQDGWSTFPRPNTQRGQQRFEIWIRPVAPHNALFALRQALYETDRLVREGIPEQGFEDTRQFLMNYRRLWVQDADRRLGYAIDGALVGREIVEELGRRLPSMAREDVDRAIRKYLGTDGLTVAIVTSDAQAVRDALLGGAPTPIVYDTEGTPEDILAEDRIIEAFPLAVSPERIRIVPASALFER